MRITLILTLAFAHLLFFQNCSKIAFENTDALSEKSGVDASGFEANDAVDNQDDSDDAADNESDLNSIPVSENSPDLADGAFPGSDLDVDSDDKTPEQEAACASFRAGSLSNFDYTFDSEFVKIRNIRGSVKVLSAQILKVKNMRGPLFVEAPLTGSTGQISDKKSRIFNLRGPVCVQAAGSGKLKGIRNQRGYAELVSLSDVGQLRNLRGKLVIRNSHVERIINHRGPIVLINSRVERIRNQRGSITMLGSSSVGKLKNIKP